MRKDRARELRNAAILVAQTATDAQAVSMPSLYPAWAADTPYGGEGQPCIVTYYGALYRCITAHTSQVDWPPNLAASLWAGIDVTHAGTIKDPIPAAINMEYTAGLYYSEGGTVYRCTRDTGQPVAYLPSQLVGQYFEEVTHEH